MPFKPNYGQARAERQRNARAKSAEKKKKLDEKTAERKAAREALEPGAEAAVDEPEESKQP